MTGKHTLAGTLSLSFLLSLTGGLTGMASAQEQTESPPAVAQTDGPATLDATSTEASSEPLDVIPVQETESEPVPAVGFLRGLFPDFDLGIGGFLRLENAASTSSRDNPANQLGNTFNGRSIPRQAYTPPAFGAATWASTPAAPALGNDTVSPGIRGTATDDTGIIAGQAFETVDNQFNYQVLRSEFESTIRFTQDLALIARVRGLFDATQYDEFDAATAQTQAGIDGGDPRLYQGTPNYFDYIVEGGTTSNPLEWSGRDYQVYFPALVLDYSIGALNVRAGNQQIAWGQALFFRVFDVVNGLDLRRHLVLDYAQEEYADERVPSLSTRLSWQFSDELLADAYVQKFQPTVYPNPNTPYNVIPVAFTVHDLYSAGGYDDKLNYGLRFKGNYGQWGFQAAAVRRYNPDGVFRWTESGVVKPLQGGPGSLGETVIAAYDAKTFYAGVGPCDPATCRLYGDIGEALSHTPFEASPGGVYSANEWYNYAAQVRLDGINGLNSSITEFPASMDVYASPAANYQEGFNELNTFFISAGGSLRGHIAREYFQEDVYALGASYVVEGEPGGVFDQLIINLEHSLTKGRTFTATTLSRDYPKMDSNITALVMEKYYRFTDAFPATYFVFQYMRRDKDDLFGRLLTGYGGTETNPAPGVSGGANYYVLAFQQPFPQDVYRAGFAALYDPRGSLLVQPGLRWKPNREWQVDGFYTYINGALGNANPNETLLSTIDYTDEFTLRLSYQF